MQVINYYDWTLVKVTKEEAWKSFNRGLQIVMTPSKTMPFSEKAPTTFMNKRCLKDMVHYGKADKVAFFDFCRKIKVCSCNQERGKTLSFFVKAKRTNLK